MTLLVVWWYSPVADRNVPPLCLAYHIIHTPAPPQSLGYSCLSGSPFISHRNVQVFPSPQPLQCSAHVNTPSMRHSLLSFPSMLSPFPQVLGLPPSCPRHTLWAHRQEGLRRRGTWQCFYTRTGLK